MSERVCATHFSDSAEQDIGAPDTLQDMQTLLVLDAGPDLAATLGMLCATLDIALVRIASHHDLPYRLHHDLPIAVVSVMDGAGTAACNALRSVAAHDPDLPVLLVTEDDPSAMGMIDAAEQLWGLTGIHRIPEAPGPQDIIFFLFQAGRRRGVGRLLPVV